MYKYCIGYALVLQDFFLTFIYVVLCVSPHKVGQMLSIPGPQYPDRQPRQLRELGCCAVQIPQFSTLDIDPASPLLNEVDVQFSLRWSKEAKQA